MSDLDKAADEFIITFFENMSQLYFSIKDAKVMEMKYFPKSASAFSRKIQSEEQSLRLVGYKFYIDPKSDATYIKLEKIKERARK